MKVKICGITNLEDAKIACEHGADAVGFIFSKKSPRCLSLLAARKIIRELGPFVTKVGVFLDQDKEEVLSLANSLSLDVLQFHGRESASYCNFFKPMFKIIKVFFLQDTPFAKSISCYKVDAYMFDIKYEDKLKGLKVLPPYALKEISSLIKAKKRVIVSGGLDLNNILKIKKFKPYAVDASSSLEAFVGKKDKKLLIDFIKKAKS